jgi:hypothetical protein
VSTFNPEMSQILRIEALPKGAHVQLEVAMTVRQLKRYRGLPVLVRPCRKGA